MATGPGYTAWFTNATIEERVGGKVHFGFGPMGESAGEVRSSPAGKGHASGPLQEAVSPHSIPGSG